MKKRLFHEEQRFRQLWVIIILVGINCLSAFSIIQQLIFKKPFGNNPMSDSGFIILECFMILFTIWFLKVNLIISVYTDGIYYKFSMFWLKTRIVKKEEIKTFSIRKYDAIKENGGWGIKGSKKSKAYTISGNKGIQLKLINGIRILFGTQKPNSFYKALDSIMNNN